MVVTNADSPFVLRDERLCFGSGHAGQVVDIQVALSAETRSLVTNHLFPVSVAWGSDSHVVKRIIESGHTNSSGYRTGSVVYLVAQARLNTEVYAQLQKR